jgi:hypothetical protein
VKVNFSEKPTTFRWRRQQQPNGENIMSSFLVNKKTIDRIVDLVKIVSMETANLPKDKDKLGQLIWILNHRALHQRYNDPIPEEVDYTYEFDDCLLGDRIDALECWLYQCYEGDVPELLLYKEMAEIKDAAKHLLGRPRDVDLDNWE